MKLSDAPLTIVQPDLMNLCNFSKMFYYKNYGVGEYWIVDLRRKIITVNDFEKDIINVQYSFDSTVKVNIYDDLYIDFADFAKISKKYQNAHIVLSKSLASCRQMCYIENRKGKPKTRLTRILKH